jgi:hypothetical protein
MTWIILTNEWRFRLAVDIFHSISIICIDRFRVKRRVSDTRSFGSNVGKNVIGICLWIFSEKVIWIHYYRKWFLESQISKPTKTRQFKTRCYSITRTTLNYVFRLIVLFCHSKFKMFITLWHHFCGNKVCHFVSGIAQCGRILAWLAERSLVCLTKRWGRYFRRQSYKPKVKITKLIHL